MALLMLCFVSKENQENLLFGSKIVKAYAVITCNYVKKKIYLFFDVNVKE